MVLDECERSAYRLPVVVGLNFLSGAHSRTSLVRDHDFEAGYVSRCLSEAE